MERWSLEFLPEAEKDLAMLDSKIRQRIIDKLDWFLDNFGKISLIALTSEFRDFYKLRAGDWRVIYKINWQDYIITVCYIDRRDKIYKKK